MWSVYERSVDPNTGFQFFLTDCIGCEIGFIGLEMAEFFCAEFNRRKVNARFTIVKDYAEISDLWFESKGHGPSLSTNLSEAIMEWAESKALVGTSEECMAWVDQPPYDNDHFARCSKALRNLDAAKKLEELAFTKMQSYFAVDNVDAAIKLKNLRKRS